jgi:hypothetical protein
MDNYSSLDDSINEVLDKKTQQNQDDPLDDAINEVLDKDNLKPNLYASTQISPVEATNQYRLFKQTNIPIEVLKTHSNEVKQMTEFNSFDVEELRNNFPKVAMQLEDIAKAPAIRDDIKNLSYFEKWTQDIGQSFTQGKQGVRSGDLGIKMLMGKELTPTEKNELDLFKSPVDYKIGYIAGIPSAVAESLPAYGKAIAEGAIAATPLLWGGPATYLSGVSIGTLASIGIQEAGNAMIELDNIVDDNGKKLDPDIQRGAAISIGIINGTLERFGLGYIASKFPGGDKIMSSFTKDEIKKRVKSGVGTQAFKRIGKAIGTSAIAEGSTEALQEISNIVFTELAKASSTGNFESFGVKEGDTSGVIDFFAQAGERIKESAIKGSQGGAGFGAAGSISSFAFERAQSKRQNEFEQTKISEALKNTKESKIFKRDPELFVDATDNTLGEQNIYIPADKAQEFFQSEEDYNKFVALVPEAAEQLQEAIEVGGNLVLPANKVLSAMAQNPSFEALQEWMKLTPESLNNQEFDDSFFQEILPETQKENSRSNEIEANIEKQLMNSGLTPESARLSSQAFKAFYETQSARLGEGQGKQALDKSFDNLKIQNKASPAFQRVSKIDDLDLFIDKARRPQKAVKTGKPLLKMLKDKGGVRIGSVLAGELNAMGITQKTAPTLFRKEGLGDIDNIPISEFQDQFPNANLSAEGDYVNRQDLLDAISNEVTGEDISQAPDEQRAMIEDFKQELENAGIDIEKATNQEVKDAIKKIQEVTYSQNDFQQRVIAAQELGDSLGKKLKINSDGSITLYHGTSKENSTKILESGELKDGAYFSVNKGGTQYGDSPLDVAKRKFGKDGIVMEIKLDARDLESAAAGSEVFSPKKLIKGENGVWATEGTKTFFQGQESTKTEAFKKWFGDSKIVDEKGEPLVVYHGTNKDFSEFKPSQKGRFGKGIYLTTNEKDSKIFGEKTLSVYATIKNPYIIKDETKESDLEGLGRRLKREGKYDGIRFGSIIVAFEPTQIKSVENTGAFNAQNPNIYNQEPTFYSQLEKQLTDLPQGKGSPEQWAGIIKNLTQKGVKQEELDWTGIEEWLKEQEGSVTKEQILEYLAANKIEVEEVVKGDYSEESKALYSELEAKNNGKDFDSWKEEDQDKWMAERGKPKDAKFDKYVLAGGENYRELLMTLPKAENSIVLFTEADKVELSRLAQKVESGEIDYSNNPEEWSQYKNLIDRSSKRYTGEDKNYKSPHFDEANILAHIRFNERTDADGSRVMFVEEVQSDWHQEGRKKGYKDEEFNKIAEEQNNIKNQIKETRGQINDEIERIDYKGFDTTNQASQAFIGAASRGEDFAKMFELPATIENLVKKYVELEKSIIPESNKVPNAPFKTTWDQLAFKRALMWAVENKFDKVAWTTGEQQADRFDLSKQIKSVSARKTGDEYQIQFVTNQGTRQTVNGNDYINIQTVEDNIGKELAKKIEKQEPSKEFTEYSGLDLKVGGEGMKAFYDKMLPSMVNKLVKKFGGKVEATNIKDTGEVWSLEITPSMRKAIQEQGLPLFQGGEKPKGSIEFNAPDGKTIINLFEGRNASTILHEAGHFFLEVNKQIASFEDTSEQIKKDWQTTLDWLGSKDGNFTRDQHEKFARGFEAYLYEGKAPSIELRDTFRRFKAWLVRIYQDIRNLNVKVSKEVTGVFDRMLATSEQIEALKSNPMFRADPEITKMLTSAEKADYIKRNEKSLEKAKELLLKKILKQKEREGKKEWNEKKEQLRKETEERFEQSPLYNAVHFLKTGKLLAGETELEPFKMDRKAIKDDFDAEIIKYLPNGILGKDGVHPEMLLKHLDFLLLTRCLKQ